MPNLRATLRGTPRKRAARKDLADAGHAAGQRVKILRLLQEYEGQWVPLPLILKLRIASYTRRISELRRMGFTIENETVWVGQVKTSRYRYTAKVDA